MSNPYFLVLFAFLLHQVAVRLNPAISSVHQYAALFLPAVFFQGIEALHARSMTRTADEMSSADR